LSVGKRKMKKLKEIGPSWDEVAIVLDLVPCTGGKRTRGCHWFKGWKWVGKSPVTVPLPKVDSS